MYPFNKQIKEIDLEDIQALQAGSVLEGRTLDYKRDLHDNSDKGTKDFLIDVSSLANTAGGYLVIGVSEEDGVPVAIDGIELEKFDDIQLRFDNLLRMSVDPPIRGVEYHPVDIANGKKVLIIEVPRSLSRPHAIVSKQYQYFHGRNASGNYKYAVDDIRKAILESESIATKIRNFRNDRLAMISVGDEPLLLQKGAKLIVHLIPALSSDFSERYEVDDTIEKFLDPIYCNGGYRYTIEGFMKCCSEEKKGFYALFFHNGIIESFDTTILSSSGIPSGIFELHILKAIKKYLKIYQAKNIYPPIWVAISMLGVNGYIMHRNQSFFDRGEQHLIQRKELIIPAVQIIDLNCNIEQVLKPAFDSVWQACNYPRSFNYDGDGNWVGGKY